MRIMLKTTIVLILMSGAIIFYFSLAESREIKGTWEIKNEMRMASEVGEDLVTVRTDTFHFSLENTISRKKSIRIETVHFRQISLDSVQKLADQSPLNTSLENFPRMENLDLNQLSFFRIKNEKGVGALFVTQAFGYDSLAMYPNLLSRPEHSKRIYTSLWGVE